MEYERPALCRICRPAVLPHRQRRLFGRGSRNHQARARPQKAQTRPHPFAAVGQAGLQDSSKMLRQYQRPLGGAVRGMRRRTAPSGDSQPQLIPTRGVRSCLPAAHRHPGIWPTATSEAPLALRPRAAIPLGWAIQNRFDLSSRRPEKNRQTPIRSADEAEAVIADAACHGATDFRTIQLASGSQALMLTERLDQYRWIIITRRLKVPASGVPRRRTEWRSREIRG